MIPPVVFAESLPQVFDFDIFINKYSHNRPYTTDTAAASVGVKTLP